ARPGPDLWSGPGPSAHHEHPSGTRESHSFVNPTAPPLFGEAPAAAAPTRGLAPAHARIVTTGTPDMADREQRHLLLLVVDCPYCDCQHIHPAGHAGTPRLCIRRSRCVGTPGGAYFFPEVVHQ
ncbi:hypothetical protein, partial [Streptomyces sp. NPDC000880]